MENVSCLNETQKHCIDNLKKQSIPYQTYDPAVLKKGCRTELGIKSFRHGTAG